MERKKVRNKKTLIRQGDLGDFFYGKTLPILHPRSNGCMGIWIVVESGHFEFKVNGTVVGDCGTGDSFGELALIYDTRRAASVG